MRCSAAARSPTSPGAARLGRRDRSPAAIACATSLSSTTGRETARAKTSASTMAASAPMTPAASDRAPGSRDRLFGGGRRNRDRAKPSGACTAKYSASSPTDGLTRMSVPVPRARAARISGRVAWFSMRARAAPSNSESPTTLPDESMSVTRSPSAAADASASESGSIPGRHSVASRRASATIRSVVVLIKPARRPALTQRDHENENDADDEERADEEPLREAHGYDRAHGVMRSASAGRAGGTRIRAPSRSARPPARASRAAAERACPRCASGCRAPPPTPSRGDARAPARDRAARRA